MFLAVVSRYGYERVVDHDHGGRQICCPSADFRNHADHRSERYQKNGDRQVNFPVITQRPPIRSVVTRQLIDNQMCGRSSARRTLVKTNYKKDGGNGASSKITGGVEAAGPKEFPWMVGVDLLCEAVLLVYPIN